MATIDDNIIVISCITMYGQMLILSTVDDHGQFFEYCQSLGTRIARAFLFIFLHFLPFQTNAYFPLQIELT